MKYLIVVHSTVMMMSIYRKINFIFNHETNPRFRFRWKKCDWFEGWSHLDYKVLKAGRGGKGWMNKCSWGTISSKQNENHNISLLLLIVLFCINIILRYQTKISFFTLKNVIIFTMQTLQVTLSIAVKLRLTPGWITKEWISFIFQVQNQNSMPVLHWQKREIVCILAVS